MKLWQKATLVCIAVLLVVVMICSAAMLIYSWHLTLNLTREQVQARQKNLAVSFGKMTDYYRLQDDRDVVRDSLVLYCFNRFADTSSVLAKEDVILYSNVSIDPTRYLVPDDEQDVYVLDGKIDGRNILIVGSTVMVQDETYLVYEIEDTSAVHNGLLVMAGVFSAVCIIGTLFGAVVMSLLVRRYAQPLVTLSIVSKRIAGGEYDIRADIHTKDEIGALAADFNTMADAVQHQISELRETAERQQLFIGGVGHEFKTPLTVMLLHTELLQDVSLTEEERTESLAYIETQCEWLERLTQKLLKIIVLKKEITKKETPARELIARVQASTEQIMADRGTVLDASCDDSTIIVDADLMQSLLVNLVDNASKAYDPDDADRTVGLSICNNVLEVSDAGRGIPADALERIFEPFYMVDKSRSKQSGGSGLGLALVKQIADAHGARLEVHSESGKGTAVRVILQ